MQIAAFVRALKVWWQHAWHSTVRTFHLVVAFLFFAIAALVGQKACSPCEPTMSILKKGCGYFT